MADTAAAGGWIDPPPYLVNNCEWLVRQCNRHPHQLRRFAEYSRALKSKALERVDQKHRDELTFYDLDARNCLDMCALVILYTAQYVRWSCLFPGQFVHTALYRPTSPPCS